MTTRSPLWTDSTRFPRTSSRSVTLPPIHPWNLAPRSLGRIPPAAPKSEPNVVEMALQRILINETSDQQYIFLKEKGGARSFPIVIGYFEALAIDRFVKDVSVPRPMTHDLLAHVLQALDAK